jgi:3-deoxy-manno-octulosonate cytidylyltransferase (CMP-KDO synthetase)
LVQHVVEAARGARAASGDGARVVVATDHERIAAALEPFGTPVVMTRSDHPNGTSRLAEAAAALGLGPDDVVVNVQGDEPEMAGEVIDLAVGALDAGGPGGHAVGTVAAFFGTGEDAENPHIVKVVRRPDGSALYFSRSMIPFERDGGGSARCRPLRHVGVYAYRRAFLEKYVTLAPTPLECCEQLEQLRVLEHGYSIGVGLCECAHTGIDTPEQYEAFVARWNATKR